MKRFINRSLIILTIIALTFLAAAAALPIVSYWETYGIDQNNKKISLSDIEKRYQKAIEFDPGNPKNFYEKSKIYYNHLSLQGEGLKAAEQAISLAPTRAKYQANVGQFFESVSAFEKAADFYQKASDLHPSNSYYHFLIGRVYWVEDKKEEAFHEFRQAINWDPDLYYMMKTKEIIGNDLIFNVLPGRSNFFINLATLFYKEKDIKMMKKAFEEGILLAKGEGAENEFLSFMHYSNYLKVTGRYAAAGKQLQKAAAYKPRNIKLLVTTADAYEKAGYLAGACEYYKKAYDLSPLDERLVEKIKGCS